ncbi:MAG: endonuclease [Prevotellaceae bacterium]|nr:endonuclease [Prevotellaceae bacterium]
MKNKFIAVACAICLFGYSLPTQADIPANYYSSANNTSSTNDALRIALYSIINSHTIIGYSSLPEQVYAAPISPSDFNNGPNNTLEDIYSSQPYKSTDGGASATQCGTGWNKEHSFPKSWFGDASPMMSDAFHIYPTDIRMNSARSNYPYGDLPAKPKNCDIGYGKGGSAAYTSDGVGTTIFDPGDAGYKGDLARTYFYMLTCYRNKNLAQTAEAQVMVAYANSVSEFTPYSVSLLMKWHREDPVSSKERIRNDAIYVHQGNRNPFIDYPCLAEYMWGDSTTKSVDFSKLVSSYDASFTDQGCPCETPGAPIVNTPTYTEGLTAGGNIASTGDAAITENGIEWSNTSGFSNGAGTKIVANPTATTTGAFTVDISSLTTPGTYYFKAYATNSIGTSYSAQSSFTIIDPAQVGLGPNLVMGTLVTNDIAFGASNSKELFIKISNVTSDITITLTNNNNGNYKFATGNTTTITLTAAEATAGKKITLTRDGGTNGATLTISGNGVNKVHNIGGN